MINAPTLKREAIRAMLAEPMRLTETQKMQLAKHIGNTPQAIAKRYIQSSDGKTRINTTPAAIADVLGTMLPVYELLPMPTVEQIEQDKKNG